MNIPSITGPAAQILTALTLVAAVCVALFKVKKWQPWLIPPAVLAFVAWALTWICHKTT